MSGILNFLISLLLTGVMMFSCAFLFLWANIEEIKMLNIIPEQEEDKNDRY